MSQQSRISRRTALKGLGVSIALPCLEAMLPGSALAREEAELIPAPTLLHPKRMVFIYVPNGVNMAQWVPSKEGKLEALPPTLRPLEPFRDQLTVLSGLTLDKARPNGDGPGDHARAMASFLTGRQARKTSGADIRIGISVDQLAAQKVGSATRFASLEIGCEGGKNSGNCDSGYSCAYSANLSWRTESTPMSKETNPRLVFERLFGTPGKTGSMEQARRDHYKQSILDFVAEDANDLRRKLGSTDQRKLDEYMTGVREIEQRINKAQPVVEVGQAKMPLPRGIPGDYGEHIRLMGDLLALAFQADLTRVSTFVFANDGSNRSYRGIDVPEGHHDLSHHGRDQTKLAKLQKINEFHIKQLAYLLNKLKSIKEGDGNVLDNSMIVYGSGIGDGNRHNHDDLPILLMGKGGGTVVAGRHLVYPRNTPLMNLYLSLLDRVGAHEPSFGDSTGRLSGLDG
jgi:hypothetical protein